MLIAAENTCMREMGTECLDLTTLCLLGILWIVIRFQIKLEIKNNSYASVCIVLTIYVHNRSKNDNCAP